MAPPTKPLLVAEPTPFVLSAAASPVVPLTEDRTVKVKGIRAVMVRTMTASGESISPPPPTP